MDILYSGIKSNLIARLDIGKVIRMFLRGLEVHRGLALAWTDIGDMPRMPRTLLVILVLYTRLIS